MPDAGEPDSAEPLRGRRILVVDDEEDVRIFLTTLLEDHGAETLEASDGAQAVTMMRSERPDLVTLDLSMPGTDGVEAFTAIRADTEISEIPVCIITGHPEFRQVIYQSSVRAPEGYLDKPVNEGDVVRTVRRILETGRRGED